MNHQARGSSERGSGDQADLLHAFRLLETQTSQQQRAQGLQAKDKVADAQHKQFTSRWWFQGFSFLPRSLRKWSDLTEYFSFNPVETTN